MNARHIAVLLFFVAGLSSLQAQPLEFSIDPLSPEPWSPADLLESDGTDVRTPAASLGLLATDDVDAFSYGDDEIEPLAAYFFVRLAYSVRRGAVGNGGAVSAQSGLNGAAGDKFQVSVVGLQGMLFPIQPAQLLSDAPWHQLTPNDVSDLDGLALQKGGATNLPVYFSVPSNHPTWGPAAVIVVRSNGAPPQIFATAAQLGLLPGDDIDALAIGTVPPGAPPTQLGPGVVVWVSLRNGSPTRTAIGMASNDGVIQVFPGPPQLVLNAAVFDLGPGDDLDALTGLDPGLPKVAHLGQNKIGSVEDHGDGSYTIVGGGNDIWDNHDEGTFAYTEVTGDFDVRVRVRSLSPNARSSKAGLMVRETLAEDSRMAFVRVTPPDVPTSSGGNGANNVRFSYRTGNWEPNGPADAHNGGRHEDIALENPWQSPPYPNAWLRLKRNGSILTAYNSADGVDWHFVGSQDTANWGLNSQSGASPSPIGPTLLLGLAVSRHSGGPTATAELSDFQLVQPSGGSTPFRLIGADSQGNPNGLRLSFSHPLGGGATNPTLYFIDGPEVTGASIVPTDRSSIQLTTSDLIEGTTYFVGAFGVPDSTGTELPGSTRQFTHGKGYEQHLIHIHYNQIPGPEVSRFTDSLAHILGLPTDNTLGLPGRRTNTLFEDPTPDNDTNENYSCRISGVLNITETGSYRFYCNSDDQGSLFLSTDENPVNKVQIAGEPEWNGSRQYATLDRRGDSRPNVSAPQTLTAGKQYYLEFNFSEGAYGNNGSVAWQTPGQPEPGNDALPIPESAFSPSRFAYGETFLNLGPVNITSHPSYANVILGGEDATFEVLVDGTPPYSYQWQKSSVLGESWTDIPDARSSTLKVPATAANHLYGYRVIVFNDLSSQTSTSAFLNVRANPAVVSCRAELGSNRVIVEWNRAVRTNGAYVIGGGAIPVLAVEYGASSNQVILTTGEMPPLSGHTLEISGVTSDGSGGGLPMVPEVATCSFFKPGFSLCSDFNSGVPFLGALAGDATVSSGVLILTDALDNQNGAFLIDDFSGGTPITGFKVNFNAWLWGGTCCGDYTADGLSFNFANDLPVSVTSSIPEEGMGTGLSVTFDTWDHGGGDTAPAIEVRYNGVTLAHQAMDGPREGGREPSGSLITDLNTGLPMTLRTDGEFAPVEVLLVNGELSVAYKGQLIFDDLSIPFPPDPQVSGWRFGFGARTGSANDYHLIDDLCIQLNPSSEPPQITQQPTNTSVVQGESVTFTVVATGTPPLFYQWRFDGQPVPDGTNAAITWTSAQPVHAGAYDVVVTSPHGSVTSQVAILTVQASPNRPLWLRPDFAANPSWDFNGNGVPDSVEIESGAVADRNKNQIPDDTEYSTAIQVIYPAVGVGVNKLTGDPRFPFGLDYFQAQDGLEVNTVFYDTGYRAELLFVPETTGNHQFYIASDDQSELWLSTDADPANKVLIAAEPEWTNFREFTGNAGGRRPPLPNNTLPNVSDGIYLQEGQLYYLDFLQKQAGGGNHFSVTVQEPGDPPVVNGQAPIGEGLTFPWMTPPLLSGVDLQIGTEGKITVTFDENPPEVIRVPEHRIITLTPLVTGSAPMEFTFSVNGVTHSTGYYPFDSTIQLGEAPANLAVTISVSNLIGGYTRTLTIEAGQDVMPPQVNRAYWTSYDDGSTSVLLEFGEGVQSVGATNFEVQNASGQNLEILAAGFYRNTRLMVVVKLADPTDLTEGAVLLRGIKDIAGNELPPTRFELEERLSWTYAPIGLPLSTDPPVSVGEDIIEITAGGADVWGNSDQCIFLSTPTTGDFDVQVRIEDMTASNQDAKAGLMFRESTNPDSGSIYDCVKPWGPTLDGLFLGRGANEIEAGVRRTTGGQTTSWGTLSPPPASFPNRFLRLQRNGPEFRAYHSPNGMEWTLHGQTTLDIPTSGWLGLFAVSHNVNYVTTARFSHFGPVQSTPVTIDTSRLSNEGITEWNPPAGQLAAADKVTGPYWPINHTVVSGGFVAPGTQQFFKVQDRSDGIASLSGSLTDPEGNPTADFLVRINNGHWQQPGPDGRFTFGRVPEGINLFQCFMQNSEEEEVADPDLGLDLPIVCPARSNPELDAKVEIGIGEQGDCDCKPWCGIMAVRFNGVQTVVAGGGKRGKCDDIPQVTITGPGVNENLPGGRRRYSPAPNGVWTVTAIICGVTKTCQITLP